MAQEMTQSDSLCDQTQDEIEKHSETGDMESLGIAWRILQHVFGGRPPERGNVACNTCYADLKESCMSKGVKTPLGDVVKDFEGYLSSFMDARAEAALEEREQVCSLWLAACPVFWRKEFEDKIVVFKMMGEAYQDNPEAFGPKEDTE